MPIKNPLKKTSAKRQNLHYQLKIAFGLFFLFPVLGFVYLSYKYNILQDQHFSYYMLGVMCFSFAGFYMLRRLFDQIAVISKKLTENEFIASEEMELDSKTDEIQTIVSSFGKIEKRFQETTRQLERRATEFSILKELSELCHVTFDSREILYITLERALMLADADVGSVMIRDKSDPEAFVVKASIGLGDLVKLEDRIKFETSIAKYAVLNKSPLVVENIETDTRFGRHSLPQYGTKSFVIMPIKTSKEVVGVLTLSRRIKNTSFTHKDVEILTPLISNAAFTYENLWLLKENQANMRQLSAITRIFKIINSSMRQSELYQAILNEIQSVIQFSFSAVLIRETTKSQMIIISEVFSSHPLRTGKGAQFPLAGSAAEKVLSQEASLIIGDLARFGGTPDLSFLEVEGIRSCWIAPLKAGGVAGRVLVLASMELNVFQEHREFLDWAAHSLSFAMEKSHLLSAVIKREQEMDTIRQIGSILASSTFDMEQVLKYTMDMIREIINVEAGSLLLLRERELEFAHAFNLKMDTLKGFRLKLGQGIAGYVAARGITMIENDVLRSPSFFPEIDQLTGFRTRSVLCVPIISQGRVIGVIEVLNKIGGDFSEDDSEILQSIASSMSIAMENARLYNETVLMAEHERGIRGMFQKFVPKEIVDKIIHGQESGVEVIEETKTLTMLNLDIRGFTGLTKKLGPQKTVSLLNNFFSVMGHLVFKHHGIVDKYLGDGFLAMFGAPVSSTMDADNAISAALEMKKAIPQVEDYFVKELGFSVEIGISIHTGEVVVGNFGFEMKMDYTVIGDPVNAVFRMQEMTRTIPNAILISENTRHAARTALDVREVSTQDARGMEGVKVYELLGRKETKNGT
ncbi:MAG: GAF domain-containing protein [Desulfobacteraceae bacterium]|nr:MAG: GAF domain-containing protein [Desulfobacteraceae bacterium]